MKINTEKKAYWFVNIYSIRIFIDIIRSYWFNYKPSDNMHIILPKIKIICIFYQTNSTEQCNWFVEWDEYTRKKNIIFFIYHHLYSFHQTSRKKHLLWQYALHIEPNIMKSRRTTKKMESKARCDFFFSLIVVVCHSANTKLLENKTLAYLVFLLYKYWTMWMKKNSMETI